MEEYGWVPNMELLTIFPDHISEDLSLVYHGTSAIYSNYIEENGLSNNHSPFSISHLQRIINLLARLGQPSDFDPLNTFQYKFNYAGAIEHYLHHLYNHPISFTALDFAAVQYASGNSKGGQIVGKIKAALNYIRQTIDKLPIDDVDRESLEADYQHLINVVAACTEIEEGEGVVYAIRPNKENLMHYKVDHNVIFSYGPVNVENIIAKITVPANYLVENELSNQIKIKSMKLLNTPGSIGHSIIKRDLQTDDE